MENIPCDDESRRTRKTRVLVNMFVPFWLPLVMLAQIASLISLTIFALVNFALLSIKHRLGSNLQAFEMSK